MSTTAKDSTNTPHHLSRKIFFGMLLGLITGSLLHHFSDTISWLSPYLSQGVFLVGGKLFIASMKMSVVPVVFVSLVCGVATLGEPKRLGSLGSRTLLLYLLTTAIAISLAMIFANFFGVGNTAIAHAATSVSTVNPPAVLDTLINIVPTNPVAAMAQGNMLQIIVFAVLFGLALALCKEKGTAVKDFFMHLNEVVMRLIGILMALAPYGVFCLMATLFATQGFAVINDLLGYFLTVVFVLLLHVTLTNSLLLKLIGKLNPLHFFRKMPQAMLFAFSTSSSNASIPMTLSTVENKLGVDNSVASFVVPMGATINMDGTAIMQGVATVFIAHIYHIHLSLIHYLTVIGMATLASIGTAGVPGVGLITLAMVLQQIGLPFEGIGMIMGVDRLLDMVRTAVNITGDSAIACLLGNHDGLLDKKKYES